MTIPNGKHHGYALAAGIVAATGFAPLHLWPLALAGIAALFALVAAAPRMRSAFARGWWFGVGHFTLGDNWIAHAFTYQDSMPHWLGYVAVVLLSFYLAVFTGIAAMLAWRFRAVPAAFAPASAAAWMVAEYLRATVFTGFAWNPLGVLWLDTGVDQSAAWIGTYGLSGLAVLAAAGLLALARRHWRSAALILTPLAALSIIGFVTTAAVQPSPGNPPGPAIRIVQPNIPQDIKDDPTREEVNFQKLATLTGRPGPTPRLIFWPEAAVPAYLDMEPYWRGRMAALLGPHDLMLSGGDKVYFRYADRGAYYDRKLVGANNSLWVLTPTGRLIGRYDKVHLVPYGEYLPMRPLLSAIGLSRLVGGEADFWPGPGPRTLTLPAAAHGNDVRPALKMGVQICYEIIFSGQVIDPANRPDFLFNPSNDAWFGAWGPPQHLAQARLRALEEGMPIIRATPTGISAIIAADGSLLATLPRHVAGALDGHLPRPRAPTPFARHGNALPAAFALLLVLLAIAISRRAR